MNCECESCVHLLKEKYQPQLRRVSKGHSSGLEQNYKECAAMFTTLEGIPIARSHLHDKGQFLLYCHLSDQFRDAPANNQQKL